ARTCNHIIAETKACFGFGNFPHHALAIASNGLGDQMVFLKESEQFKPEIYVWLHETGEIKLLASSFAKFRVYGEINDSPKGHTTYFLVKEL
ncbi:SMI1/KNR4 family protein, partial [Aliivibrio fischeri]